MTAENPGEPLPDAEAEALTVEIAMDNADLAYRVEAKFARLLAEVRQSRQGIGREEIARIIDPEAFEGGYDTLGLQKSGRREALAKADSILARLNGGGEEKLREAARIAQMLRYSITDLQDRRMALENCDALIAALTTQENTR